MTTGETCLGDHRPGLNHTLVSLASSLPCPPPMSDVDNLISQATALEFVPGVLLVGPLPGAQVAAEALSRWGLEVTAVANREAALVCIQTMALQVAVLDAGELGGEHDLLAAVKAVDPHLEVVLLASIDTVEIALEGVRRGAFDFLVGHGALALALKVREAMAAVRRRSLATDVF